MLAKAARLHRRIARQLLFGYCASFCLFLGCAAGPATAPAPAAPPTSAQAGATTIVAVAAPAQPHMTLPEFLGLKGLAGGIRQVGQRVRNRLGSRFPGLESKPPLLSITDPANMSEDASPAVKAAAEAKAEEDQAPQKAKAIRYLASLGCGECYPDTEDALLAALEDCNEQIRFEAVKGLRKSAGDPCQCCRQNSCCSPKLIEKLNQLAYGTDDCGCFVEPSSRVRRYARLVIRGCGGAVIVDDTEATPVEGPSSAEQGGQESAGESILDPLPAGPVESLPPPSPTAAPTSAAGEPPVPPPLSAVEIMHPAVGARSHPVVAQSDRIHVPAPFGDLVGRP